MFRRASGHFSHAAQKQMLPIRAVLYVLTSNTVALVAIQILDGVGAGIFGVVKRSRARS